MTSVKCGDRFGKWTVIGTKSHRKDGARNRARYWTCRCDCGVEKDVRQDGLLNGRSRRCGKCNGRANGERETTHGQHETSEYRIWHAMRSRCENEKFTGYAYYGGRGIKVCERWRDFGNFIADMGKRPSSGHSIDRIDTDSDYCPENCHWATQKQQSNNMRNNVRLTHNGVTKTLSEWAEYVGISYKTLRGRVFQYGWSVGRALTEPVQEHSR